MEILDGKYASQKILGEISTKVENISMNGQRPPRLDIILVGEDYGSVKYVGIKEKTARELGITCQTHALDKDITTAEVVNLVRTLNAFSDTDGFMIQLSPIQILNIIAIYKILIFIHSIQSCQYFYCGGLP